MTASLGPDFGHDGVPDLFLGGIGFDDKGVVVQSSLSGGQGSVARNTQSSELHAAQWIDGSSATLVVGGGDGVRVFRTGLDSDLVPDEWVGESFPFPCSGMWGGAGADLNHDGAGEVLTFGGCSPAPGCGVLSIVADDLAGPHDPADEAWARLYGSRSADACIGETTDVIEDVTGDGNPELLVASEFGKGRQFPGTLFIVGSVPTGDSTITDIADITFRGSGDEAAGTSDATADDLDGDGYGDLVMGAVGDLIHPKAPGMVYLLFAPSSGHSYGVDDLGAKLIGDDPYDDFGCDVDAPGDLDGDGFRDLLVGAVGESGSGGQVYVVHGPFSGTIDMSGPEVFRLVGSPSGGIGSADKAIVSLGDLDGDGTADFALGRWSSTSQGGVYLFYGPT